MLEEKNISSSNQVYPKQILILNLDEKKVEFQMLF